MSVSLVPFSGADFPRLISWIRSREAMIQWAGPATFTYPLSNDQLIDYLHGSRGDAPARLIYTAVNEQGAAVGHIELGAIDRANMVASVCRVLVAPSARGCGVCLPMVRAALEVGFGTLRLRRIDLKVYSFNTPAIRCYRRAGFNQEGHLRQSLQVGEALWDTIIMAVLRSEWEAARQSPGADPA